MTDRHDYPSFEAFLAAVGAAGVRAVSLRAVRELRPRLLPDQRVEYGLQQWVELSGYAAGTVYAARLEGADPLALQRALEAQGVTVKASSGNII